jgi:hypothetical protein
MAGEKLRRTVPPLGSPPSNWYARCNTAITGF